MDQERKGKPEMVKLRVSSCMFFVRLPVVIGTMVRMRACGLGIGTILDPIRTTMLAGATMICAMNRNMRMTDDREMASLLCKNSSKSLYCGSVSEALRGRS